MSDQAAMGQQWADKNNPIAKKRKRNTISCFQCRVRKRRCTADYIEKCENCVREGLECRKPDIDGRKTRWKKGRTSLEPDVGLYSVLGEGSNGEHRPTGQGDFDGLYSGGLFDLFMGSDTPGAGPSMHIARSNAIPETSQSAIRSQQPAQPFRGQADAQSELGLINIQHRDPQIRHFPNMSDKTWDGLFDTSSPGQSGNTYPFPPIRHASSPSISAQSSSVKKVVWWRFHGPSAIAPGLKRITLKVRLDEQIDSPVPPNILGQDSSSQISQDKLVDEGGMPRHDLMLHLLDVFMTHFGCQYPALSRSQLERDLSERSGSTLLFNCIASTASRFSKHPDIALSHLEPHAYGLIFLKTAKNMLGNVLAVPSRETVIALTLLAGISHGIDSESEEWMAAGMAVRMAIDLGLHLVPPSNSSMSEEDRRLNRLTFWSVYFLDVSLSFGVGRETAFRLAAITQTIPSESDFMGDHATARGTGDSSTGLSLRHVFAYAAKLAYAYGPLVNVVNGPWDSQSEWDSQAQQITQQAVEVYNTLPQDMQWSALNLQTHSHANQGSTFVQMHLWMHTILASGYLIGTDVLRPDRKAYLHGNMTPSNTTASRLWQNSARTIGDILILSDIVNPFVYHALPFSNQPFVVAGCCYIKDADAQLQRSKLNESTRSDIAQDLADSHLVDYSRQASANKNNTTGDEPNTPNVKEEKAEMFRTLLQSVTSNNITALRQGLIRQTRYWAGVAWVAEVLSQRMSGISMEEIDLRVVTENLDSTVATTDARMFNQSDDENGQSSSVQIQSVDPSSAWFDMPLSLESDWLADTTFLQSQGYPVVVEDFTTNWAHSYM